MAEKLTAFAVCGDQIAETVGTAEDFILWDGQTSVTVRRQGGIVLFLARHAVATLVCGGIGNCLGEVLAQQDIRVIPGIEGVWQEAASALANGTLAAGESFTCTERGRICGDCPGNF